MPEVLEAEVEVLSEEVPQEDVNGTDEESPPDSPIDIENLPSIQRELADAIVRLAPVEELEILLEVGADVDKPVTQGLTPLHYAIWQKYQEAAEFLISRDCNINALDDIGYSALHLSAEHGYIDMMELLLKHKCMVNFNDQDDDNYFPTESTDEPLRLAIKHDHYDAAKLLLENGANANTRYFFGAEINLINPLNTKMLQLLLMYGANPDARDRQGFTPTMKACRLQQESIEELEGRNNITGQEVLQHFAQTLRGIESVLLLITHGADVNARTEARHDFRRQCHHSNDQSSLLHCPIERSVLHYAVLSGSVAIVNLLLKQGARVNFEKTYNKPSPLDLAILKGDVEIINVLLESGADLAASSPVIGSPLHMACSEGIPNRMDILQLLLEKGADPNLIIFGDDESPIRPVLGEYLSSNPDPEAEVISLFLKYGAQVVMQSQNKDPRGILNSLPNLSSKPDILITLLEAAHNFDINVILNSSLIDEDQRQLFLKVGQSPLPLKHLTRVYLRQNMGDRIPPRVDELELPKILEKYLLYEIS
ncbi:unnamed protein product [Meganyctiphanes norvegica]|uniref:SOCS box domain-containing protein n=1 Tax=Meganyctiphanes norvegica TaxID=48144 RepID=A0AAV2PZ86_MEGNR